MEEDELYHELSTNIGKMNHDKWDNVVLLRDGYWFVSDRRGSDLTVGEQTFLEFYLSEDADYQFLKNRYEIGKCINGNRMMRSRLSVNAANIISIQQYES